MKQTADLITKEFIKEVFNEFNIKLKDNNYLDEYVKIVNENDEGETQSHHIILQSIDKDKKYNKLRVNLSHVNHAKAHFCLGMVIEDEKLSGSMFTAIGLIVGGMYDMINLTENEMSEIKKYANHIEKQNVGQMVLKDTNGNIHRVSQDCLDLNESDLVGIRKGKVTVINKEGNTFSVSIDDERLKSGELRGVTIGYITLKDKDGNTFSVYKSDPRIESGELVGVTKGELL